MKKKLFPGGVGLVRVGLLRKGWLVKFKELSKPFNIKGLSISFYINQ